MIQLSELAGWTQDIYNDFISEIEDPAFSFVLEAYNLDISTISQLGVGTVSESTAMDAIACDDVVIRVWPDIDKIYVNTLASENSSDQDWAESSLTATDIVFSVPPTLAVSGNTVRIFWYDNTGIKYFESTDKGSSWGAAQDVGNITDLIYVAATDLNTVHCAIMTAKDNTRLGVFEYDAAWSYTSSYVYWPFQPTSFDAIRGNQKDDWAAATNDIIGFTSDLPPMIGYRVDGTELVQYLERVQGVIFFRYQNGHWSDHFEMDVIDNIPASNVPARSNLRLTKYGEWMFATYKRVDGSENYNHSAIGLSRSKTGIHWEMPYLISAADACVALVKRGSHVYLVDSAGRKLRSPTVGYVDDPQLSYDVTERVMALDIRSGDLKELQITCANPQGVLDTILDQARMWQMRLSLGYYIDGVAQTVQAILADLESISRSRQIPTDHRILAGRNALGRPIALRTDYVREWQNTQIGGDNFDSIDDTKYSGLRHTANMAGHWEAVNNELLLNANAEPGIAFNLQTSLVWNGSAQMAIKVSDTETSDFAGPVFRAHNKYNLWHLVYDADDDMINLVERRANEDTTHHSAGAMGWSIDTFYYLKVTCVYSYIYAYYSTDGVTWVYLFGHEVPGVPIDSTWTFDDVPIMRGSQGYIGHGYSDSTGLYPGPPWTPPPIDIPIDPGWPDVCIFPTRLGGVWYTTGFSGDDVSAQPLWHQIPTTGAWPGDDELHDFATDTDDPFNNMYAIAEGSRDIIKYNGTTWSTILSQATYSSNVGVAVALAHSIWVDIVTDVVWLNVWWRYDVSGHGVHAVYHSSDGGSSWDYDILDGPGSPPFDVQYHEGGNVMAYNNHVASGYVIGTGGTEWQGWSSTDGGSAWLQMGDITTSSGVGYTQRVHIAEHTTSFMRRGFNGSYWSTWKDTWNVSPVEMNNVFTHWVTSDSDHAPRMWGDPSNPLHWRIIKDNHLLVTYDAWASHIDKGQLEIPGYSHPSTPVDVAGIAYRVAPADTDKIVYQTNEPIAAFPHCIFVANGENDTSPEYKSGNDPVTPDAFSIPYTAGGSCYGGPKLFYSEDITLP